MQNTGLRNRFDDRVRQWWGDWHACLVCRMNQWDALHHVVSPSSRFYVDGPHNESILNSCPIHNYLHPSSGRLRADEARGFGITEACHVGNEAWLGEEENLRSLLSEILRIILDGDYRFVQNDDDFIVTYAHLYSRADLDAYCAAMPRTLLCRR